MRVQVSWQQVVRNGIPPLAAIRRPLEYGDKTFAVGEVLTGLPDKRLRQFYEQRRAAPVTPQPVAEDFASSSQPLFPSTGPGGSGGKKPRQKGD